LWCAAMLWLPGIGLANAFAAFGINLREWRARARLEWSADMRLATRWSTG
jgi:hypothetical protein